MPAPTITPLPTPPSRGDAPETFNAEADAFLGAFPTLQSEVNAVATWMDSTAGTVATNASTASTAATTASNAASAMRQPFGAQIYNAGSALIQGIYNGDYNADASYTINRFTAVMEDGTTGATADITVLVDGVAVYGPVTVTFGTELATTPSYSIPSGANDAYLVERMTGTVRKLYIRADGVPS